MDRTNKPTILFRHNYDPAKAVKSAIDQLLFLEDFAYAEELLGINKEKQK